MDVMEGVLDPKYLPCFENFHRDINMTSDINVILCLTVTYLFAAHLTALSVAQSDTGLKG